MNNVNAVTKAAYSATNQEHLEGHKQEFGLVSDEWAGFKQWADSGRQVIKGAKGCRIFMFVEKIDKKASEKTGEIVRKKVMKSRFVFNLEHTQEAEQE